MIKLNTEVNKWIIVILTIMVVGYVLQGCTSTSTYTSTTTQIVTGGNDNTSGAINNVDSSNAKQENHKVETKSKSTSQIKVL